MITPLPLTLREESCLPIQSTRWIRSFDATVMQRVDILLPLTLKNTLLS